MKKYNLIFCAMFLGMTGSPITWAKSSKPAVAGTPSQQPMTETVEGEVREKLTIQKKPPKIELTPADLVESGTLQTDNVLQQTKPVPSESDYAMLASTFNFTQILDPANPLLPEPPLINFQTGLANAAAKHWEFRVSDDKGEVVKSITGKGNPPRTIVWDGRTNRGPYITIGTLYSYQFLTYDEFNNVNTYPGEPFQLDALMYQEKGKIHIEISNKKLFKEDDGSLNPGMKGLWDRAMDVVREHSNGPISVEIDVEKTTTGIAELKRQNIVNAIASATSILSAEIRHRVDKISERGDVTQLILATR